MNLSCEIVMDLLPLYIDGLASQESGAEIKEHLRSCPQCRKYYHSYHKITAAPLPPNQPLPPARTATSITNSPPGCANGTLFPPPPFWASLPPPSAALS